MNTIKVNKAQFDSMAKNTALTDNWDLVWKVRQHKADITADELEAVLVASENEWKADMMARAKAAGYQVEFV